MNKRDLPERIARRIREDEVSGCWVWVGVIHSSGYGQVWHNGTTRRAHRVVYELLVGSFPPNTIATHGCDNPGCVRPHPDHVRPGTITSNNREAFARGRKRMDGEHHSHPKLTWDIVRDIRQRSADGERQVSIAARYGVDRSLISRIKNDQCWVER